MKLSHDLSSIRRKVDVIQDIWLQITRVWKITRSLMLDLRFGGLLGKVIDTRYAHLGAVETSSTNYDVLPHIFGDLVKPTDVLVDIGCGRGRVIRWWLSQEYGNKILGIELDSEVARYARKRTRRFRNVTIIEGNILDNIPEDGTIFYMYNPFTKRIVENFRDRMLEKFENRKEIILLYYNCRHVDVFNNDPHWQVEEKDLTNVPNAQGSLALIKLRL